MRTGFGDVYTVSESPYGVRVQSAGYQPRFLPRYNPNMRHRSLLGLGNLPTNTVSGALTYLNEIVARMDGTSAPDDVRTRIETEAAALAQGLGEDPSRKLTFQERLAINKLDDKSYKATGAWYRTSWFRYGLVAAAIAGGVYVVYRSYQ